MPGPPYLPFCWMGCLDGHGGPLPNDWIPRHVELERKILARERALGMTPVLQGFTGHVPEALVKKFPGTKVQRIHWSEFSTCMLDPQDPLFQKVATSFIEEQARLFGSDHLYDADSFIEMNPPSGDLKYLAGIGRAIYEGMAKADPKAVWLLQGWTFMNQAQFLEAGPHPGLSRRGPQRPHAGPGSLLRTHPGLEHDARLLRQAVGLVVRLQFRRRQILGGSGPLDRFHDLAAARKHPSGRSCAAWA